MRAEKFSSLLFYCANDYIYIHIFSAEKIMRGNYDVTAYEDGEGELAILGFQFNQMSKRLNQTLEQMDDEKEALKRGISDLSHRLKTPLSVIQMNPF
jgi:signal transduction histidine kinase